MKRVALVTLISTLATIAAWCYIRGDLGFGGEMIIPIGCSVSAILREVSTE